MEPLTTLVIKYKYLVLFPFAAFEGPVLAVFVGLLIHNGFLSFLPTYGILILGDLIPDSIYYGIGFFGTEKPFFKKARAKMKIISDNFHVIEDLWRDHPKKTMFLSKLAYGLSTPFLMSAGAVKMPFRKFVTYALPITLFQYLLFLTLGYFIGNSYEQVGKYIEGAGMIVALVLILFVVGYILLTRYAKKKLLGLEREEEKEMQSKESSNPSP